MSAPSFTFRSKLWEWHGDAAWHFLTLDQQQSKRIKELFGQPRRGFGSLPVRAVIGTTEWKTSIFPSREAKAYMLPVKAAVRAAEQLRTGAMVNYKIYLVDV